MAIDQQELITKRGFHNDYIGGYDNRPIGIRPLPDIVETVEEVTQRSEFRDVTIVLDLDGNSAVIEDVLQDEELLPVAVAAAAEKITYKLRRFYKDDQESFQTGKRKLYDLANASLNTLKQPYNLVHYASNGALPSQFDLQESREFAKNNLADMIGMSMGLPYSYDDVKPDGIHDFQRTSVETGLKASSQDMINTAGDPFNAAYPESGAYKPKRETIVFTSNEMVAD